MVVFTYIYIFITIINNIEQPIWIGVIVIVLLLEIHVQTESIVFIDGRLFGVSGFHHSKIIGQKSFGLIEDGGGFNPIVLSMFGGVVPEAMHPHVAGCNFVGLLFGNVDFLGVSQLGFAQIGAFYPVGIAIADVFVETSFSWKIWE